MRRFLLGLVKLAAFIVVLILALVPVARGQFRQKRMDEAVEAFHRARNAQAGETEAGSDLPVAVVELPKLGATLPVWEGDADAEPGGAKGAVRLLDRLSRWFGLTGPVDGGRLTEWVGLPGGEAARCAVAVNLSGLDRLAPGDCLTLRTGTDEAIYEIAQVAGTGGELAWPEDAGEWLALERNGRRIAMAKRMARRAVAARDDSAAAPGWISRLVYMVPVVAVGVVLLGMVEGLRRGMKRWRLQRMRL